MTLNSLEVTKCCKNLFILFFVFCLQNFLFFTFLFLKLFLDEPAMVLRYIWTLVPGKSIIYGGYAFIYFGVESMQRVWSLDATECHMSHDLSLSHCLLVGLVKFGSCVAEMWAWNWANSIELHLQTGALGWEPWANSIIQDKWNK